MALLRKHIHNKLSASTIPEVLTAMVIMGIVFAFSMTIIANVSRSGFNTNRQNAVMAVDFLMQETVRNRNFVDLEAEHQDYLLTQTVTRHEQQDIVIITIIAKGPAGNSLYSEKRLMYEPEE